MSIARACATALAVATLGCLAAPALARADGRLVGRVTDAAGRPLVNACVHVGTPLGSVTDATTAANGGWSVVVPAGRYGVSFTGCSTSSPYIAQSYANQPEIGGGPPTLVTVRNGAITGGIDATLRIGATIAGTLVDLDTGTPFLRLAQVSAATRNGSDETAVDLGVDTAPEPNGSFALVGLPSGSYLVKASGIQAPDEWYPGVPDPGRADLVTVTAGETTSIGRLGLGRGGAIAGVVRDWHGSPIADTPVSVEAMAPDLSTDDFDNAVTDAAGRFTAGPLAPGTYTVAASVAPPGNVATSAEAIVTEGGTSTVDVTEGRARVPAALLSLRTRRRGRTLRLTGRISEPGRVRGRVTLASGPVVHRRVRQLARLRTASRRFAVRVALPRRYRRLGHPRIRIEVDGSRWYEPTTFCRMPTRAWRGTRRCPPLDYGY